MGSEKKNCYKTINSIILWDICFDFPLFRVALALNTREM